MELFEFFCQIAFNKFELVQAQKKHFIRAAGARPAAAGPYAAGPAAARPAAARPVASLKVMQSCLSVYCILLNQTYLS